MILRISVVLAMLLCLAGCFAEKESTSEPAISDVYIDLLSEQRLFEDSYGDCESDSSSSCTIISLEYPYFTGSLNTEAEARINEHISSVLTDNILYDSGEYQDIPSFASAFIGEYKEVKDEFGEAFGWQYDGEVAVVRNDSLMLGIRAEKYIYTGGAHGMQVVEYMNFDPETGTLISLDDVFKENYSDRLNEVAKQALLTKKQQGADEELAGSELWIEDGKYYNENFLLMPSDIRFYYNQYEIASYAAGPMEISIPLDSIKGIMK